MKFLVKTPCIDCKNFCKNERHFDSKTFHFCRFNFQILNPLLIESSTFYMSVLIFPPKLALWKNPFKTNPYLRDKIELRDFSLKWRFYCIWYKICNPLELKSIFTYFFMLSQYKHKQFIPTFMRFPGPFFVDRSFTCFALFVDLENY